MGTELAPAPVDVIAVAMDRGEALEDAIPLAPTESPPTSMSRDDASALSLLYGNVLHTAEKVKAATLAWYDLQQKRLSDIFQWYGPGMRKLAQDETRGKKTRKLLLPFGVLALRKDPDRLVQKEGDEATRQFKVYDARAGHKWSRVKASFESLTHDELDQIVNLMPDPLLQKFRYQLEPAKKDLIDLWKSTGEIANGFEVKFGEDQLTVDFSTKEESA